MDIVVVIAIIAGPILAIQTQQIIERIKQKHEEKRRLFMTLMATRNRPLVLEHVQSLNMIDIVFSGKNKKDKAVIEAWSELRDHLYSFPQQPPAESGINISEADRARYQTNIDTWLSKKTDLLIELLAKMAELLNYHFDKVLLKRGAYTPASYGEDEADQYIIRKGVADLFQGLKSIPISIVKAPPIKEKENTQEKPPNNPPTS